MTTVLTLFALASSFWRGLSVLAVALQCRLLCLIPHYLFYIQFGLAVVLCMLGPVSLGDHLAC